MKPKTLLVAVVVSGLAAFGVFRFGRSIWVPVYLTVTGERTVGDAVDEYGDRVDASLRPLFEQAGLKYTPTRVAFLFFKEEKRLELWGQDAGPWAFVKEFEIKAASLTFSAVLRLVQQIRNTHFVGEFKPLWSGATQ